MSELVSEMRRDWILQCIGDDRIGSWICSKRSWLMFKLIKLLGLVLNLAKFCTKLSEFGTSESRRSVCKNRIVYSLRFGFRNGTVSSWFSLGRQLISE